jgi:hypothetical protein
MRLFSFFTHRYTPLRETEGNDNAGSAGIDYNFYYLSPFQIWAGKIVSRVYATGIIQNDWLPRFPTNSNHLRYVFKEARELRRTRGRFLWQKELGGMLMLGAFLEVRYKSYTIHLFYR